VIPPLSKSQGHSSSTAAAAAVVCKGPVCPHVTMKNIYPEGNKNMHFSSFYSNKIFKNEKMYT